jgi:DNA-binding IscR family transcriptional regulator
VAQSGRFGLGLRVLAVLAAAPDAMHTSAAIAEALSESAVVIRRLFLLLESGGLIEQRRGPGGGARLKAAAQEIGVGDVYCATEGDWLFLGDQSISILLKRAREEGLSAMNAITLAQVLKRMALKPAATSKTTPKPTKFRVDRIKVLSKKDRAGAGRPLPPLIPISGAVAHSYAWQ